MSLTVHTANNGVVESTPSGWVMMLPAGMNDRYRLAELENYWGKARGEFPSTPPLELNLRARVSSSDHPGTWGFGFWNDPFPAIGLGPYPARPPALPNAVWFFFASPRNYLSFRDDKPARGMLA